MSIGYQARAIVIDIIALRQAGDLCFSIGNIDKCSYTIEKTWITGYASRIFMFLPQSIATK